MLPLEKQPEDLHLSQHGQLLQKLLQKLELGLWLQKPLWQHNKCESCLASCFWRDRMTERLLETVSKP